MKSRFPLFKYENILFSWNNFSGVFWVTMLTVLERQDFGEIVDGVMKYSTSGLVLKRMLENLHLYYPSMAVPAFVVFPDGFEAIVMIRKSSMITSDEDVLSRLAGIAKAFKRLSHRSKRSPVPVDINVWISRSRQINRNDVKMVFDIYENRISQWIKAHK